MNLANRFSRTAKLAPEIKKGHHLKLIGMTGNLNQNLTPVKMALITKNKKFMGGRGVAKRK